MGMQGETRGLRESFEWVAWVVFLGFLGMAPGSAVAGGVPDTLFVDGFESGDLSAWSDGIVPPIVDLIISPTSGPAPLTVRFDASGSFDSDGSIDAFWWDFGDGTFGSGPVVEHEYLNPGTYTVFLLLVDAEGISSLGVATVLVEEPNLRPEATFTPASRTGFAPVTVTFDASGTVDPDGTVVGFDWDLGDGTTAQGVTVEHTYGTPGTYEVLLTAVDDRGGVTKVGGTVVVETSNDPPEAAFVATPLEGSAPLTVSLDASSSHDPDGTVAAHTWDFGNGDTATGATVEVVYPDGGDYLVTLTVTDDRGLASTARERVRVVPPILSLAATEPRNGEGGVACTRETILRFDGPVDPTTVTGDAIFARFAGTTLPGRLHLSPDGRTVTLFYDALLPASARVRVTVDGDRLRDLQGRAVDADGDGIAGGRFLVDFDTLNLASLPGSAVCGRVLASEPGTGADGQPVDEPLPGVTVTVDGLEDSMRAVTAADGTFCLDPSPAERFFVHIDGTTSTAAVPTGAYYPRVGKAWPGAAGQQIDVGDVFLPLIPGDALQDVSTTEDVEIGLPPGVVAEQPELAGTEIQVPADSLFADDGTRGGQVGVAPVAPDRLPGELPEGAEFPLVITVQTDGATNFDRPAPVCFPNLPGAATGGQPLPPGAKSALWSFNHDTGRFEVVGPMTVTDDGKRVCTDPGVGVRAPGWHGNQPGTGGDAPGPRGEPGSGGDGGDGGSDGGDGGDAGGGGGDGSGSGGVGSGPGDGSGDEPEDPSEEEEDECEGASAWDVGETVYNVGKEAARCAVDLFKLRRGVRCLVELSFISVDTALTLRNLIQDLSSDETTGTQQAASALAFAKNQKSKILAIARCVADVSPVGLGRSIFNCIGNALSAANAVCDTVEGPSDAPPECQPSELTKVVCQGLAEAKNLHTEANALLDVAVAKADQVATAAVCAQVDELEVLLNRLLAAESSLSPEERAALWALRVEIERRQVLDDLEELEALARSFGLDPRRLDELERQDLTAMADRQLTAGERQELIDQLDVLATDLEELAAAAEATDLLLGTDALGDQVYETAGTAGRDVIGLGDPDPGRYFYLLELANEPNDVLQRGETGPGGGAGFLLPPDNAYRYALYDPRRNRFGESFGRTAGNGERTDLVPVVFGDASLLPDSDGDGLADAAEQVVGTSLQDPDTDGDGVDDRAEVEQGTDPTDGLPVTTGILSTLDTPGTALDVCALDGFAALADGEAGVTLVEAFLGRDPTVVAQVDTPGTARAIACAGGRLLVADDESGVAVIDVQDPPAAFLARQIEPSLLGGRAQAVAADAGIGYVGLDNGDVVLLALDTGALLDRRASGDSEVQDLRLAGDELYVLTDDTLRIFGTAADHVELLGGLPVSGSVAPLEIGRKLFVGGGRAYVGFFTGYSVIDVTDPTQPVLLGSPPEPQAAVHDLAANGSGLLLVPTSFAGPGSLALSLYDASDPTDVTGFLTSFETPGDTRSVAVFEGLAYVADGDAGLQIVSYLPYDNLGVPPGVTLSASFDLAAGTAEEGKLARITAQVTDDVQVREVEFYLEGRRVRTDGSFPFEVRFLVPRLAVTSTFRMQVRAVDTGGNETWTPEQVITITPDATPPEVSRVTPPDGSTPEVVEALTAYVGEPLDPASIDGTALQVAHSGPDGALGTADDRTAAGTVTYRAQIGALVLTLDRALPPTAYRAQVGTGITDRTGNPPAAPFVWTFTVPGVPDRDGDGVPDVWEPRLGLDPDERDTDLDGVVDGLEDTDGDGLLNADEVLLGTHPDDPDTDDDGVSDGDEVAGGEDPLTREIALDQPVSGEIAVPFDIDRYTFAASAGLEVFVDFQGAASSLGLVDFQLFAPDGTRLDSSVIRGSDPGSLTLPQTGTYRVEVGDPEDDGVGTYAFQLWSIPAADEFSIAQGDAVSDGVPGSGAGNIETPGSQDVYLFAGTAGQEIFVDFQGAVSSLGGVDFQLFAPDGTRLDSSAIRGSDPGAFTLSQTGTYRVEVGDPEDDGVGTYAFQLWSVPAADELTIALGDAVSDGVPGAGAGNIETPGSRDVYLFAGTAGQEIFVDFQGAVSSLGGVDFQLFAPDGVRLDSSVMRGSDPGALTLPQTGTYRAEVGDPGDDGVGTYAFQLWSIPAADEFSIALGEAVSDGVPDSGAGNIETPGARDVYLFAGTAGQGLTIDLQGGVNSLGLVEFQLRAPDGTLLESGVVRGSDPDALTLPQTGTYRFEVGDTRDDGVGTYAFQLLSP